MLLHPKGQAVFSGLNTHYLILDRLLDHCQGRLGHGAFSMRGPDAEGIIFFDTDGVVNAVIEGRDGTREEGPEAAETLMQRAAETPFALSVYALTPETAFLWANTPHASPLYTNLSSGFTNLQGLVDKLSSEQLTGYVDVSFDASQEGALVLLDGGVVVGGSYAFDGAGEDDEENLGQLLARCKNESATFNVFRIAFETPEDEEEVGQINREQTVEALEALLNHLEDVLAVKLGGKPHKLRPVLNRKFLEKADRFAFLDPFRGELEYTNRRLSYFGEDSPNDLVTAILEVSRELVVEYGAVRLFEERLKQWSRKYAWLFEGVSFDDEPSPSPRDLRSR